MRLTHIRGLLRTEALCKIPDTARAPFRDDVKNGVVDMRRGAFRGDDMGVAASGQAAFKAPEALAIWVAMASISGGDRQS
jgi:hypothetical protein